jgi:branched-chain amino acid transport system substrate-binding protein
MKRRKYLMKLMSIAAGVVVAGIAAGFALPALAQDKIYAPLLTYRTGPFASSGVNIADGMADYLTLLNERDGGIGGVKLEIEECETGYDTKKGVECYESTKSKNPVMYNPYSTGITLQLIPKAAVDKVPVLSMAYGLSAAAKGDRFPWIFNPPLTYWDGASVMVRHMAAVEGGFEKLKGKKLGLIHLDAPYGKEPIPVLEAMAKKYGFELVLYPIPAKEMQNQGSVWLNIRRDRPDWLYNQGWGAMNPTAVKEAVKNNFPLDRFVAVWWAGDDGDAKAGDNKPGYKALAFHAGGKDFPVIKDIEKHVVAKGLSKAKPEQLGQMLYNRGVYNAMLIAESVRQAQKITGKKVVVGEDVRRGLETLEITEARLKEMGMEGFAAPLKVTCANHSGHNKVHVVQWDGNAWKKVSDWMEPIKELVLPLMDEAATEYVTKNTGWPQRSEKCDG